MLVLRPAFFRHSERNWWLREGKKLSDIKGENTRVALSEPASPDKMSEVYSHICCGSLPDTPELMRVEEAIG